MKANLNRCAGLGLGVVAAVSMAVAQPAGQSPLNPPANGPRRGDTTWNALSHATVHVKPGQVLEDVTVVIRDGRIESVGKGDAPGGAKVWDCTGLQVYAGFVDPFVEVDAPAPDRSAPGVHWNSKVTPQRNALDGTGVDERTAESMRKLGFTAAAIAPRGGIFRGSASVVSLAKPATELSADRPPVFVKNVYQVIGFESGRAFGGERPVDATPTPAAPAAQRQQQETPDIARWSRYPDSQMGAIALMRQTLIDADWQSEARKAGGVLATNCLDTLTDTGNGNGFAVSRETIELKRGPALWFDTSDELEELRAAKIAHEFGREAVIIGTGTEYQRLDAIKADGLMIVVPLNYPRTPDVAGIGKVESVDLRDLMAWEQAPTNPRRLEAAGVKTVLTTARLRAKTDFPENLSKAIKHGLNKDVALAMLTTRPAELLGVADRMGTVEKGKVANLVVVEGDLFDAWPKADAGAGTTGATPADAGKEEKPAEVGEAAKPAEGQPAAEGAAGANAGAAGARRGAKIRDVWVDGARYEVAAAPGLKLEGTWAVTLNPAPAGGDAKLTIDSRNSITVWLGEKRTSARGVSISENRIAFQVDEEQLGMKGVAMAQGVVEGEEMHGSGVNGMGSPVTWSAKRTSKKVEEPARQGRGRQGGQPGEANREGGDAAAAPAAEAPKPETPKVAEGGDAAAQPEGDRPARRGRGEGFGGGPGGAPGQPRKSAEELEKEAIAAIPEKLGYPFGPYALEQMPEQADLLIIWGATIWTAGPDGIIENGEIEVSKGKITYVGKSRGPRGDAMARADAASKRSGGGLGVFIDATGKHISPGIIDAHSHTGISRGVNEGGQAVTAEVRIEDVTNPDDISWYRQLAGGVTATNNLHGSANAIGGQNCVNKVRWGVVHPDQMHFEGAMPGIKFALGENPRQVNGGGGGGFGGGGASRYPTTRMGVETLIRDRFTAAKEYIREWHEGSEAQKGQGKSLGNVVPPRRDLELEALAEILQGKRLVHCHSYRQDEILMLCRVSDDFGFKIGTFQHVLEGYKVADEIAKHAIGGSCFTDWWAYKMEVQDAIPQDGPIMAEQGVVVSFNSDSDELARRLNVEAGKGIKYGNNVAPNDAIKFVTLNPAKQLMIDKRVGSLEVGKDADLAVWSGAPISSLSRCEATYVDGRKLFSLEDDAKARETIASERTRIIQKVLAQARTGGGDRPQGAGAGGPGGGGGGFGGRRRPPNEEEGAADLVQYYLDLMTRGQDPMQARQGECGESGN